MEQNILLESMKITRRIMNAGPLQGVMTDEIAPGVDIENDNEMLDWVKKNAETTYHPVGTCKMGNDPMAVVEVAARAHEKFLAYPSAFAATVALGVVLNFASYFVISTAGALALKVLGTVRNTALVVVGVSYFHDACSGKEAAGYCISLAGSAAFLYLTHRQEVAAVAAAATTSSDASKSDANKDKGARKDESEEDEEAAEPLVGVEQNSVANVLEEGFDDIGKAAAPWSIVVVLGSLVSVQGHKEDSIDDDAGDNDT